MQKIDLLAGREAQPRREGGNRTKALLAFSSLLFLGLGHGQLPALAAEEGVTGDIGSSVTVTRYANKAADAWEKGDYTMARDAFRQVISYVPGSIESYEGLMNCCEKTHEWPQVAFACEKLFSLSPERKKFYEYDYGVALYNMNQFDQAIPHLKAALATADIPPPPFKPIKVKLEEGGANTLAAPEQLKQVNVGLPPVQVANANALSVEDKAAKNIVNSHNLIESKYAKKKENFENAIMSEFICIAEYKGYDKSSDIRYNSPPATHWHIDKILKGPPLGSALPLRFDFHTPDEKDPPAGWKFDESKLPEKGSKWIIFIEWAASERGLYNTYWGSYGRQPATDQNLNALDNLLREHNMLNQGL
jgi:tetratricopeptide (TPR) repeat protein